MKTIKKLLMDDGFLAVNKKSIKKIGYIKSGVLQSLIDCQAHYKTELFYKSKQQIADELGLSIRTIEKYVSELIKDRYINFSGKTGNNRNLYSLNMDMLSSIIDDDSSENNSQQLRNNFITDTKIIHNSSENNSELSEDELRNNFITDTKIIHNSSENNSQQLRNNFITDMKIIHNQKKEINKERNKEKTKESNKEGEPEMNNFNLSKSDLKIVKKHLDIIFNKNNDWIQPPESFRTLMEDYTIPALVKIIEENGWWDAEDAEYTLSKYDPEYKLQYSEKEDLHPDFQKELEAELYKRCGDRLGILSNREMEKINAEAKKYVKEKLNKKVG